MRFTFPARGALTVCAALLTACATATTPTNTTNTAANRTANVNASVNTGANTANPIAPQGTPVATHAEQHANVPHPEIKRIGVDETRDLLAKNSAVVVDTRGESAYQSGHIKGALSITSADLEARIKQLPRDKKIITYCS